MLGLAGKGRLASFSRHSHCMAGPPSEAERPLWRQLRHGMPQQRARRTPRSTQRAAQSHRSDLVALELRGAKLLITTREIHLRYCSAAVRPLVTGVHTSDVPASAATLSSATLARARARGLWLYLDVAVCGAVSRLRTPYSCAVGHSDDGERNRD